MHNYKITLYDEYEIEAETEAEAREIAIEDWAEKYNVKLTHRTSDVRRLNASLPAITVKARMDAFDPPLYSR